MRIYILRFLFGVSIIVNLIGAYFVYHKAFDDKRPAPWASNKVILLGDSRIHRVNWHKELSRTDLLNAGISGITTEMLTSKLDSILAGRNPDKALIQIGVNDIRTSVPMDKTLAHYATLIRVLKSRSIEPIVTSVISIRTDFAQDEIPADSVNTKVKDLNRALAKLAASEKLKYLDVNKRLSQDGRLKLVYTEDGIHLSSAGNKVFASLIKI